MRKLPCRPSPPHLHCRSSQARRRRECPGSVDGPFCSVGDSLSGVGSFRPLPSFPSDAGTATTNPQPLRTSWLGCALEAADGGVSHGGRCYLRAA